MQERILTIYSLLHVCAQAALNDKTDSACLQEVIDFAAESLWKIHEELEEKGI